MRCVLAWTVRLFRQQAQRLWASNVYYLAQMDLCGKQMQHSDRPVTNICIEIAAEFEPCCCWIRRCGLKTPSCADKISLRARDSQSF